MSNPTDTSNRRRVWTIDPKTEEPIETNDPAIVADAALLFMDPYVNGMDGRIAWTLGPRTLRSIYVGDGEPGVVDHANDQF